MEKEKKIDLLDYVVILVKYKFLFIITGILTAVLIYLAIYFFVDEKFDSSALIIPSEDSSMGPVSGMLGGFASELPFSIGDISGNPVINMYNTIIYSRTNLDKIIDEFNLIEVYEVSKSKVGYREDLRESLAGSISAGETENMAYQIEVRSIDPQLSADITNFIVEELNKKIIELRTEKSKNNREFLENRLIEITTNLNQAEDSLTRFQKNTGVLQPEVQYQGMLSAYSKLESELIEARVKLSIVEQIRGTESPQYLTLKSQIEEYEKKLTQLKSKGEPGGVLPSFSSLPDKGMSYLRLMRNVEINSSILEFMLPLYEQAKVDEKKDIPTLQVIDYAVPPPKKSYPPRLIFTILIVFGILLILYFYILLKENVNLQNSEKFIFIKKNIFSFRN